MKAFKKLNLLKGESVSVNFSLRESDFFFWTSDKNYQLVEGSYIILVGTSSGDIRSKKEIIITRQNV